MYQLECPGGLASEDQVAEQIAIIPKPQLRDFGWDCFT